MLFDVMIYYIIKWPNRKSIISKMEKAKEWRKTSYSDFMIAKQAPFIIFHRIAYWAQM